ncbi:ATP-binding protein, partial [Pantoea sp. SIMBA_072]
LMAARADLPAGEYIAISVTDSGRGISAENIKRIFDPFFTTKPLGQGTGLGLSMVHGFVLQSGGQIDVHSQEGVGTTVRLLLPKFEGQLELLEGEARQSALSG